MTGWLRHAFAFLTGARTPEPVAPIEARTCPHCRMPLRYGCREIAMDEQPGYTLRQVVRCAICGQNSAWLWGDGFPDGPAVLLPDEPAAAESA